MTLKNKNVILNEHVLLLEPFKRLYNRPQGLKYIAYCFYMTCPYEDENPFANVLEEIKSERILKYLGIRKIPEDYNEDIKAVLSLFKEIYETPIVRLYNSIKNKVDDIAKYLENTKVTDKNIRDIRDTIKSYKDIVEPYKSALKEMLNERALTKTRGNQNVAYDQL